MYYRWFHEEGDDRDEFGLPLSRAAHDPLLHPQPKKPGLTRGEATGAVLAAALLLYGLATWDVPLSLFCAAFLAYLLRPLVREGNGRYAVPLSNMMYGFSIAAGAGALIMAFL